MSQLSQSQQLTAQTNWLTLLLLLCLVFVTGLTLAKMSPNWPPEFVHNSQSKQPTQGQSIQVGETPEGLSVDDWDSIQQQISSGKYRAYPNLDGGYNSSNPAHGWQIGYHADGTTHLSPRDITTPAYEIGIKLTAIGYGKLQELNLPQQIIADDSTVTYQWNDYLKEWWINTPSQLEQWFRLSHRPASSSDSDTISEQPLALQLNVISSLPISQHENSLRLTQADGNTITYNKLKVWDATGRNLPARMQLADQQLKLIIDDSTAHYPLTIDPSFQQQAYLKASNTEEGDEFGFSVAISGDTVVVGAPSEDSNATGVNGDQSNNDARNSGAAYVFVRSGTGWSQQAYLKASNAVSSDRFGASVAIDGDTIVVGSAEETVNIDNLTAVGAGAAYVFTRSGTTWSLQTRLIASNPGGNTAFGNAVAIADNTVVVGEIGQSSNATGINGDESNRDAAFAGAVHVFTRSGTNWSRQAFLKASNTGRGDQFGISVVIDSNTVVVGANREESTATGINGDQSNNDADNVGAVYVFTRSGTTWSQQAYLKASNAEGFDEFGWSVDIAGDTVVVGANDENSNATGVNGDQSNNDARASGAAYVFTRSGTTWSQQAYLKASNSNSDDHFGQSVAIAGDIVVVGAWSEDSNATGVNGDQSNESLVAAGAAYVFTRTGTTWSQQDYLKASNTDRFDEFGRSVAISGDTIVIGAEDEASNATDVNGDQTNNAAADAGAAYVFTVDDLDSGGNQGGLDIDGNGQQDALSDGLLVIRYIFGLTGDALITGAMTNNCTRCSNTAIENYLGNLNLDVDANGTSDALTDGLLILRYQFGLTGNALIDEAVASDCTRCSHTEIEDYLGEL